MLGLIFGLVLSQCRGQRMWPSCLCLLITEAVLVGLFVGVFPSSGVIQAL